MSTVKIDSSGRFGGRIEVDGLDISDLVTEAAGQTATGPDIPTTLRRLAELVEASSGTVE